MAELPSGFWAGWIVALTVGGFGVLGLLVYSVYFRQGPAHEDHVWDGDLREGDAPAPIWWFWLILALMVFSVIYLLLYPGLGSYAGALKWSQAHHLALSVAAYEEEFAPISATLAARPIVDLENDEQAMASARSIFANNCAACHGANASGQANRFPDLSDAAWQWGGSPEQIEQSIVGGRRGVMPAWNGILNADQLAAVGDYVRALSSDAAAGDEFSVGREVYQRTCVACHGADGRGNALVGAPDLSDDIWLYGADPAAIEYSIAYGRSGTMPAQGDRLTTTQIRLLTAWLAGGRARTAARNVEAARL